MSRLIVLSELDCSEWLDLHGIAPSEFYTDFSMFKKRSFTFTDVNIVCVLAGTCGFSRKHIRDYFNHIDERRKLEKGQVSINYYILSDTELRGVDDYYRYTDLPLSVVHYKNGKEVEEIKNFWKEIDFESSEKTEFYLSEFDKNDLSKVKERAELRGRSTDSIQELIKIPDISGLLKN